MSIEESRYSGLKKKCVINYLQSESNDHCNIGHIDIGVWIAIDLTSILLIYVICIYVSIHETVLDRGEVKSNDLYESAVGFGEVSSKERIGRRCRKAPSLYDSLGRSEEKPIHWYSLVFNAFVRLFISVNESHHVFVWTNLCTAINARHDNRLRVNTRQLILGENETLLYDRRID